MRPVPTTRKMRKFLISLVLLLSVNFAAAFTASPVQLRPRHSKSVSSKLHLLQNFFESFTSASKAASSSSATSSLRDELKGRLIQLCRSDNPKRSDIEAVIIQLQEVNPTPASASSPLLQRYWALEWTTEKEINFFLDWNISNEIGQTIAGSKINNNIEFVKGGGFYVSGKLDIPDKGGKRTEFEFKTATLDLGKWGTFNFPPVGSGWFDTVYLDDRLRIDLNSRNDILICTPGTQ